MNIFFVTGNLGRFKEAAVLLPELEMINFDLPEEQSLDPKVVIAKKLAVARQYKPEGKLIVEDTSLYLDGLNGFPGPLIKWMLEAVGDEGIYKLVHAIHDRTATAKTVIGYDDGLGTTLYFEGEVQGKIVPPNGIDGFGWDAIFKPEGIDETFAEMGDELKPEFSMRTDAFKKLRDYLQATA